MKSVLEASFSRLIPSLILLSILSMSQIACDSTFGEDQNPIRIPLEIEYKYGLAGPYDFNSNQLVFPFERTALDSIFSANGIELGEVNSTEALTALVVLDSPGQTSLAIFEQILLLASAPNKLDLEIGSIDTISSDFSDQEISFQLRDNRDVSDLLASDNFELRLQVRPREGTIDPIELYRLRVQFTLNAFVNS